MLPMKSCMSEQFIRRSGLLVSTLLTRSRQNTTIFQTRREKKHSNSNLTSLFHPVAIKSNSDDINVGAELSSSIDKNDMLKLINHFAQQKEIQKLCVEVGLHHNLQIQAFQHFRKYCMEVKSLPTDLHIVFSDILQGGAHIANIFPYFIRHAKKIFPHIDCLDDLKKISDLRTPANWYQLARTKTRKIIFHAGPTNSGKTYQALKRFMNAKNGVYCGPLKLLVSEVYHKSNENGTPCDLITGEEIKYAHDPDNPASHVSCSIEMVNINNSYEVAVIDEIQLMRDQIRGWAWTRALLGICADEIHLCGEAAAIDLVNAISCTTGENVEVHNYKRLTDLVVENKALEVLENVQPGDCIVCFNKNDIFTVTRKIESIGKEVAVIYGSLPPGTKLAQAAKFNDPSHSCKILVATNAIGMGLNLHIRRIIFYSLIQPITNEKGGKDVDTITVSSALQIAGRAGRYKTRWETGYVTTFRSEDLETLQTLLNQKPEVLGKAGLHPTADQIELYAYYLPNSTLSNLMDIFVSLSKVDDSLYFMCNVDDFKYLADMIQHVPLPLRARYVFCCAPINKAFPFVSTMFLKFAWQYSKNSVITFNWLSESIGWPPSMPKTILDLVQLEAVFDIMDLYLWLSYRFMDLFPHGSMVRENQKKLDLLIQNGIVNLTNLLVQQNREGSAKFDSQADNVEGWRKKYYRGFNPKCQNEGIGKGRLTEKLLSEGLLTPRMLEVLQNEWSDIKKRKK